MTIDNPERALAFSYAPRDRRAALIALFALDDALGQVLRTTREPMVGQMRLAWWREALARLDEAPPPGEPVLQALAAEVLPSGVSGRALAGMVDGWEALLAKQLNVFVLQRHAVLRGAGLFDLATTVCGSKGDRRADMVGRGWAFADLATHIGDPELAKKARAMAACRLPYRPARLQKPAWPGPLRPLGALALLAARKLTGGVSPSFVLRLAIFRLTGR